MKVAFKDESFAFEFVRNLSADIEGTDGVITIHTAHISEFNR
jgi:hypothetical protein